MTKRVIQPGRFYWQRPGGGLLEDVGSTNDTGERPTAWICRRVADFPHGQAPAGAAFATCTRCAAPIAYYPARVATVPANTPKVCMQCARIVPLPIEET